MSDILRFENGYVCTNNDEDKTVVFEETEGKELDTMVRVLEFIYQDFKDHYPVDKREYIKITIKGR